MRAAQLSRRITPFSEKCTDELPPTSRSGLGCFVHTPAQGREDGLEFARSLQPDYQDCEP